MAGRPMARLVVLAGRPAEVPAGRPAEVPAGRPAEVLAGRRRLVAGRNLRLARPGGRGARPDYQVGSDGQ
jgi:hypothetical protein